MTQSKTAKHLLAAIAIVASVGISRAGAQPPSVIQANMDYDASGYVAPAGMVPPHMYRGGVQPIGFYSSSPEYGASSPAYGYDTGYCDTGYCDGGCDGCGTGCGGQDCGILGCGGLLGKLRNGGSCCGKGGLSNLCLFCRGDGCTACSSLHHTRWLEGLACCLPYSKQGICAQRWYDLSAEVLLLSHSNGGLSGPLTTVGPAPGVAGDPVPPGQVVLSLGDADGGGELEAGARLSAAFICGPGGNLEFTYLGGNQWNSDATVTSAAPVLFSFISDFGRQPIGGFDDTDQSNVHSVASKSEFHSGEMNYRLRTVWPCCRFQGSWLVGLKYVRYEDGLTYSTFTDNSPADPDFFSSNDRLRNNLFGPQAGFDFWWNMHPGINLGFGFKGAWVSNDVNRTIALQANSLGPVATAGVRVVEDSDRKSTVMGEFEAKLVYRFSHSWALRSSYYALAVDDMAFGTTDLQTINDFIAVNPPSDTAFYYNSFVTQGFTIGAEYTW